MDYYNIIFKKSAFLFSLMIITPFFCSCDVKEKDYYCSDYAICNGLNECYEVKCQEIAGFPDTSLKIDIIKESELIFSYDKQFRKDLFPNEVIHLFDNGVDQYYYIADNISDYIAINNKSNSTYFQYFEDMIDINIDYSDSNKSYFSDYVSLSQQLNEHLTKKKIEDMFNSCEQDSSNIVKLYNLCNNIN